mmetsp:Transcript_15312/g.24423  ORF Transcript_15312/g.24423 Transcript_15312/m.24423 type:complete len:412 (-) Transcript_15312:206-1441(-)
MVQSVHLLLAAAAATCVHDTTAFTSPALVTVASRRSLLSACRPSTAAAGLRVSEGSKPPACHGHRWRKGPPPALLEAAASDAEEKHSSPTPTKTTGAVAKATFAVPGKAVVAFCAVGCALGLYALYVASHANAPPPVGKAARGAAKSGFKAWCDFSVGASCSTVAKSQYGIGMGLIKPNGPWGFLALPNAVYGILYYLAMALTQLPSNFAKPKARQIALILSSSAVLASVYLGYLLVFVIQNLCVVCVATYMVNGALLKLSLTDYKAVVSSLRSGGGATTAKTTSSVGARARALVGSDRVARGEKERVAVDSHSDSGVGVGAKGAKGVTQKESTMGAHDKDEKKPLQEQSTDSNKKEALRGQVADVKSEREDVKSLNKDRQEPQQVDVKNLDKDQANKNEAKSPNPQDKTS